MNPPAGLNGPQQPRPQRAPLSLSVRSPAMMPSPLLECLGPAHPSSSTPSLPNGKELGVCVSASTTPRPNDSELRLLNSVGEVLAGDPKQIPTTLRGGLHLAEDDQAIATTSERIRSGPQWGGWKDIAIEAKCKQKSLTNIPLSRSMDFSRLPSAQAQHITWKQDVPSRRERQHRRAPQNPVMGFMRSPRATDTSTPSVFSSDGSVQVASDRVKDEDEEEEEDEDDDLSYLPMRKRGRSIHLVGGCLPLFLSNLQSSEGVPSTGVNSTDGEGGYSGKLEGERGPEEEHPRYLRLVEEKLPTNASEEVTPTWRDPVNSLSARGNIGIGDARKKITVIPDFAAARKSRAQGHQILSLRQEDIEECGWDFGRLARSVPADESLLQKADDFFFSSPDDDDSLNRNESVDRIAETTSETKVDQDLDQPVGAVKGNGTDTAKPLKKPKNRKKTRLFLDVLVVEATDLLYQRNALQAIYGGPLVMIKIIVKKLGSPYAKVSLVTGNRLPWMDTNGAGGCHPYCTRAIKRSNDSPVWNDGTTFVYERLTAEKVWDRLQQLQVRTSADPEEAKAKFLKRWKQLLKAGPNTSGEKDLCDQWRVLCEPHLEVKVYFTTGGRKNVLVGSVSVPLVELQETFLHDLWLNLHPCTKLPAPRTEAEEKFLDKWAQSELGMLHTHGIPVPPIPVRMEVGDIILFDSSNIFTQGTKLATGSPRGKRGLCLFEATMSGVLVFDLKRRLQVYIEDTKIGIRRLQVERTEEMMEALYQFIETVKGRPYKKNPFEFIKALAKVNATDNLGSIFCSQLVAAAYQVMGLLSTEVSSNNYLPVDLASNSRVKLLKGSLGELMLVPRLKTQKKRDKS